MWVVYAIIIHSLLLGSIFVIYFRSPVITGVEPFLPLSLEPPAKRLVLIVTDGLRAESFFHNNCDDVPHMRDLMLEPGGLVGISHTHVPTESRPGHIALISGLYEDPSAVLRGWKHNPVDFDSVFNRSSHAYAWGADDVLNIFSRIANDNEHRMLIDAYDHKLDFSGHDSTFQLDQWVFDHVRLFLKRQSKKLREETHAIYFLHLLGLDSAGHVHKPGSEEFMKNLHITDRGIWEMYQLFENVFMDNRTTYVLTSDHGMTNSGSHGAGDARETETPLFLWGAGIAKPTHLQPHQDFIKIGNNVIVPLHSMQQAQMAPLMSALIGVAPPVNNFGILPLEFLNTTAEYGAHAAHSNARQLLAQFQALLTAHQRGWFTVYLTQFSKLNDNSISMYMRIIDHYYNKRDFHAAIAESYKMMHLALAGIHYYQNYYRVPLLVSTTLTFVFWIVYCLHLLVDKADRKAPKNRHHVWSSVAGIIIVILICALQRVPLPIGFYLVLPMFVWTFLIQRNQISMYAIAHALPFKALIVLILCAELLVYSFFERRLISLAFLCFALASNLKAFPSKTEARFYIWLVLVIALIAFPLLPPSVGYANTPLLIAGMGVTMLRPFLVKSRLSNYVKVIAGVGFANTLAIVYFRLMQQNVPLIAHMLSWLFMGYSFICIALDKSNGLKQKLELIFFQLTTLYVLFCTSYESLFVIMLASELMLTLSAQSKHIPLVHSSNSGHITAMPTSTTAQEVSHSLQLALAILLYTLFSFFGTGNIASVSSFDPNIARCFVSAFAPYVIMALVILKLFIPAILNICIIFGLSDFARTHEKRIFICLLLICDVMGMNFLFLVRNEGSWLEIGMSISHFVIMEVTTLILLVVTYFAKGLLQLNTFKMTLSKLQ